MNEPNAIPPLILLKGYARINRPSLLSIIPLSRLKLNSVHFLHQLVTIRHRKNPLVGVLVELADNLLLPF